MKKNLLIFVFFISIIGLKAQTCVVITQPVALTINLTPSDALCNGTNGAITAAASGGTAPYEYSIDGGLSYQSSNVFNGLASGNYTITLKDAKTCIKTAATTINQPTPLSVSIAATESSCNNNDNKVLNNTVVNLTATGSGGTPTYAYAWDNGLGTGNTQSPNVTATTTYNVTITDSNGCAATANHSINLIIAPTVAITATESSCTANDNKVLIGTSITLTASASGGNPTYTYDWDNGLGAGANQNTTISTSTTYTVTATDNNGCIATATRPITVAPLLTFTTTQVNVSCFGGTDANIVVTGSGGTPDYEYSLDNGVTYQISNTFSGLSAGTYKIGIKDSNGCVTLCN
jgi:SprB repeat